MLSEPLRKALEERTRVYDFTLKTDAGRMLAAAAADSRQRWQTE